jgi:hypothetical protein
MERCQVCNGEINNKPKDGFCYCTICDCPARPGSMDPMARKEYDQALLTWSRSIYGQSRQGADNLAPTAPTYLNHQASIKVAVEALINETLIHSILDLASKINRLEKYLDNPQPRAPQGNDLQLRQDVQALKDMVSNNQAIDHRLTALEAWQQASPLNPEITLDRPTPALIQPAVAPDTSLIQAAMNPAEQALVKLYNPSIELPPSFAPQIPASLDSETFQRQKLGDSSKISFIAETNGIFVVVKINDVFYLVPNKKRTLTPHIYRSFKFIFDRTGFHKHCKHLTLIQPAVVQETAQNQWQLLQKGILQFYQA